MAGVGEPIPIIPFVAVDADHADPLKVESELGDIKPLLACRCCFVTDQPLQPLRSELNDLYHQFIGVNIPKLYDYPNFLCSYCRALLLKFASFRKNSQSVQDKFVKIHSTGLPVTLDLIKSKVNGAPYPYLKATFVQRINVVTDSNISNISINDSNRSNNTISEIPNYNATTTNNTIPLNDPPFDNENIFVFANVQKDAAEQEVKVDKTEIFESECVSDNDETYAINYSSYSDDSDDCLSVVKSNISKKSNTSKKSSKKLKVEKENKSKKQLEREDSPTNIKQFRGLVEKLKKARKSSSTNKEHVTEKLSAFADKIKSEPCIKDKVLRRKKKATSKDNAGRIRKSEIDVLNTYNAKVVLLSKQEQIDQINARKESLNYTRSINRCEICYRGFKTANTCKNHAKKHDPKNGDFVCDICQFRYETMQKLKEHHTNQHKYNFICNECGVVSRSTGMAKLHNDWHKGVKYDCKICGKIFDKPTSVLGHMHLEHEGSVQCSICKEKFIGKLGLHMHMLRSHKDVMDAVCQCGVQFHTMEAFRRHRPEGLDCDPNQKGCAACGANFPTDELLEEHRLEYHDTTVTCEKCGKIAENIMKHRCEPIKRRAPRQPRLPNGPKGAPGKKLKKEDKDKPKVKKERKPQFFVCEMCGHSVNSRASLVSHLRTHTRGKPFECHHCQKRFVTKTTLQTHMLRHLNLLRKDYVCRYCGKTFISAANRDRHEDAVHKKLKPFRCEACNKNFSTTYSIRSHNLVKHNIQTARLRFKEFTCRFCGKTFNAMGNRDRHENGVHKKLRPFKCDMCEKTYFEKVALQTHVNTKHLGMPWPKRIRPPRRQNNEPPHLSYL